jgi:hypothetical protein
MAAHNVTSNPSWYDHHVLTPKGLGLEPLMSGHMGCSYGHITMPEVFVFVFCPTWMQTASCSNFLATASLHMLMLT